MPTMLSAIILNVFLLTVAIKSIIINVNMLSNAVKPFFKCHNA
jgi:hypothetical protein